MADLKKILCLMQHTTNYIKEIKKNNIKLGLPKVPNFAAKLDHDT